MASQDYQGGKGILETQGEMVNLEFLENLDYLEGRVLQERWAQSDLRVREEMMENQE